MVFLCVMANFLSNTHLYAYHKAMADSLLFCTDVFVIIISSFKTIVLSLQAETVKSLGQKRSWEKGQYPIISAEIPSQVTLGERPASIEILQLTSSKGGMQHKNGSR